METLNYKVLESTGYNGYILKDAPVKAVSYTHLGDLVITLGCGDIYKASKMMVADNK